MAGKPRWHSLQIFQCTKFRFPNIWQRKTGLHSESMPRAIVSAFSLLYGSPKAAESIISTLNPFPLLQTRCFCWGQTRFIPSLRPSCHGHAPSCSTTTCSKQKLPQFKIPQSRFRCQSKGVGIFFQLRYDQLECLQPGMGSIG